MQESFQSTPDDNAKLPCLARKRRRKNTSLFLYGSLLFFSSGFNNIEAFVATQQNVVQAPTVLSASQDGQSYGDKRIQARPNLHRQNQFRSYSKPRQTNRQSIHQNHNHANKEKTPISIVKFNKMLSKILMDEQRSAVEEAERLLLERTKARISTVTSSSAKSTRNLDYDTFSFNLILSAWAKQRSLEAARRADMLLEILLQTSRQSNVRADAYSYSSVLNAYAKSGGSRRAALRAEELLSQMENTMKIETEVCHNCVMECWSVSGDSDAGRRAQVWLTRLEESNALPDPTIISYNICLKAWARSKNGASQAHQLLDRMNASSDACLRPDKISYSTCIDAYSRSQTNFTMAAEKAEDLLRQMEDNPVIRPDVVAYTSLLSIFAKAELDTKRALDLIPRLKKHGQAEPNAAFLNSLLHVFAKKGKAVQTEILLKSMKENDIADKITYTTVMSAHANVGNATRARELFNELLGLYNKTGSDRYLPTEKTFTSLVYGIAKRKDISSTSLNDVNNIIKEMRILHKMTENPALFPSTITYSTVLYLLSKVQDKNAPNRAMQLLDEMKRHNISIDSTIYAYIINVFTKARSPQSVEIAKRFLDEVEQGYKFGIFPSPLFYSAVLQAYSKTTSNYVKLEKLLQRFKVAYKEGKIFAKPTLLCYNAVMDGLARSKEGVEAALRAEELLEELEKGHAAGDLTLRPTVRSYNAAILAWKTSNSTLAPKHAEALLKRMYESGCRPDQVTFNTIIGLYASSNVPGAAERAETFLEILEHMYYDADDESLKPDSISYNSVIRAWANSGLQYSGERAQQVFDRMKAKYQSGDEDLRPTFATLTSLSEAWAGGRNHEAKLQSNSISYLASKNEALETTTAADGVGSLPNKTTLVP
jgi:pentatricopeptide repeat protein